MGRCPSHLCLQISLFWLLLTSGVGSAALREGEGVPLLVRDVRGELLDLAQTRDQVLILASCSRYTFPELGRILRGLRAQAPPKGLLVVTVVDLVGVPSLFHGYAKRRLLQQSRPQREHYVIDPGNLRSVLGVRPDKEASYYVIDQKGVVRGHFAGEAEIGKAIHLVNRLEATPNGS